MKMKLVLGAAFGLALCLAGCTGSGSKEPEAVSLSKDVEYNVSISNVNFFRNDPYGASSVWDRYNIEASTRLPYLEMLLEKAESGALKLTDMNGKPIDSAHIAEYFYTTDTVMMTKPYEPFEEFDTVIRTKKLKPENILELRFKENWTYDPVTFAITKKVSAIAPVVMNIYNNEEGIMQAAYPGKPAFWINFEEKSTPTHTLTNRIISNVTFKNFKKDFVKNIDTVALANYLDLMMQQLAKDSLSCYTYSEGILFDSLVSAADFKKMVKEQSLNYKDITNLRFMEEWTFDIATMAITKKVVGVCPVIEDYDAVTGDFRGYRVTFFVYFDDVWMPFNRKFKVKK